MFGNDQPCGRGDGFTIYESNIRDRAGKLVHGRDQIVEAFGNVSFFEKAARHDGRKHSGFFLGAAPDLEAGRRPWRMLLGSRWVSNAQVAHVVEFSDAVVALLRQLQQARVGERTVIELGRSAVSAVELLEVIQISRRNRAVESETNRAANRRM